MKIYQFIVGEVAHPHTTDSINSYFESRKYLYCDQPQTFACNAQEVEWFIQNYKCCQNDALTLEIGVCTLNELAVGISLFFNKLLRHFFPRNSDYNTNYCNIFLNFTYNIDTAVEFSTACLVSFLNSGYNYRWEQHDNKSLCLRYIERNYKNKLITSKPGTLILGQNNVQPFGIRDSYGLVSVLSEKAASNYYYLHDGSWDNYLCDITEFPTQPHTFGWHNIKD